MAVVRSGLILHILGMPFTSPLAEFLFNPEYRAQKRDDWRAFKRSIRTRNGKVWFAEFVLLIASGGVLLWHFFDFVNTGSWRSLIVAATISFLCFWPFLRHRLLRGDWPNDYR